MPFVSFIIPSIGRDSLRETLRSIIAQTDDDWEAIVVLDGKSVLTDSAFEAMVELEGKDVYRGGLITTTVTGSAGLLRNEGIARASGEWLAFVDDDDTIDSQYIEHLRQHTGDYPNADVVLFRMLHPTYGILPREDVPIIEQGTAGISFAYRARIKTKFIKENVVSSTDTLLNTHEDIQMLKDFQKRGLEIYISPYIDYKVGK